MVAPMPPAPWITNLIRSPQEARARRRLGTDGASHSAADRIRPCSTSCLALEPSAGLAPLVVREMFDILAGLNRTEKVSMLLVEQNASLALSLADTAYLLETGRIVTSGPAAQIREDEGVRRSYLGY